MHCNGSQPALGAEGAERERTRPGPRAPGSPRISTRFAIRRRLAPLDVFVYADQAAKSNDENVIFGHRGNGPSPVIERKRA